jgi:hypothetical protein
MLVPDTDPNEMNANPQPWFGGGCGLVYVVLRGEVVWGMVGYKTGHHSLQLPAESVYVLVHLKVGEGGGVK